MRARATLLATLAIGASITGRARAEGAEPSAPAARIRWIVKADARGFASEHAPDRTAFVLRQAGAQITATLSNRVSALILVDFAGGRVVVPDAWGEVMVTSVLRLRVGRFQTPLSTERLASFALPFIATGLTTTFLPRSETGLDLILRSRAIDVDVAASNGATAGTLDEGEVDAGKDVLGRILVRPLVGLPEGDHFAIGLGASAGVRRGTPMSTQVPGLRSYGGATWIEPAAGVVADGALVRLVPQASWWSGPVALYADGLWSRQAVTGGRLDLVAGSALATVNVTGESAPPLTVVRPARPLDAGGPGAVQLAIGVTAARYAARAFPQLLDPSVSSRGAVGLAIGGTYYPISGVAILLTGGWLRPIRADEGIERRSELSLTARLQLVF